MGVAFADKYIYIYTYGISIFQKSYTIMSMFNQDNPYLVRLLFELLASCFSFPFAPISRIYHSSRPSDHWRHRNTWSAPLWPIWFVKPLVVPLRGSSTTLRASQFSKPRSDKQRLKRRRRTGQRLEEVWQFGPTRQGKGLELKEEVMDLATVCDTRYDVL